jgi:hypothetical protein
MERHAYPSDCPYARSTGGSLPRDRHYSEHAAAPGDRMRPWSWSKVMNKIPNMSVMHVNQSKLSTSTYLYRLYYYYYYSYD